MKKEPRDVYIADDGAEFDTERECRIHEAMLAENELLEQFLETQLWKLDGTGGKYSERTLTTVRNVMTNYIAFKVDYVDQHSSID